MVLYWIKELYRSNESRYRPASSFRFRSTLNFRLIAETVGVNRGLNRAFQFLGGRYSVAKKWRARRFIRNFSKSTSQNLQLFIVSELFLRIT